jgi:non-heme chloroperoxidase
MKYIKRTDTQTGEEVELHYADLGKGQPVVLIHGWPLSMEMWEYQIADLVESGYRVIKYDRRGFGKSSKPWNGYDYDSLTEDLKAVMDELSLENAVLVGFSMGGGEAVRYLSRYGAARVAKLVLISSVTPFLLKTGNNEDGVEPSIFDEMVENIKKDRIGFLDTFGKQFFGVNLINHPLSTPLLEYYRMLAALASQRSTIQCVRSFSATDFREDLRNVTVPTLIIHGDSDKTVPIESSGNLSSQLITNNRYLVYEGAPHGLFYTERERLNRDLIRFMDGTLVGTEHAAFSSN